MFRGLITPIAHALVVDTSRLESSVESLLLDLESCIAMRMITRIDDEHHLTLKNTDYTLLLPNTQRTTIRDRSNWIITPTRDPAIRDKLPH